MIIALRERRTAFGHDGGALALVGDQALFLRQDRVGPAPAEVDPSKKNRWDCAFSQACGPHSGLGCCDVKYDKCVLKTSSPSSS